METVFNREPVTIVELDQPFCSLTYGVSPCEAALNVSGKAKCYHTFATCQDQLNFDPTIRTLRFVSPRLKVPSEWNAIPSLLSVSGRPTRLNIGGQDSRSGPLGTRASITVTLLNHPFSDALLDPYYQARSYLPHSQGTFWGKWLARNKHWQGIMLRVIEGYLDQSIEEMQTRYYFLDNIAGPDADGRVMLKGLDVLRLADDKKAQAPVKSLGVLSADLAIDTTTSITLTGGDITDYEESGKVRIGSEIISYTTRSGSLPVVLSTLTRGDDGTTAATHREDDRVQACIVYEDEEPWLVVYDLLVNYGNIPSSFIDLDQWNAEGNRWLLPFTVSTILSEPVGLSTLISELAEQCQFYIWWDDRNQTIPLRAVRPPEEEVRVITDEAHILEDSQSRAFQIDEAVSDIAIYFDQIDPTKSLTDRGNYRRIQARVGQQFGEVPNLREIFSRWLDTANQVNSIAARIIQQSGDIPLYLQIRMSVKDRDIWTGDIIDLQTRIVEDTTGAVATVRCIVIQAEEKKDGSEVVLELARIGFITSPARYMADNAPVHDAASESLLALGAWYADDDGNINGAPSLYRYQ